MTFVAATIPMNRELKHSSHPLHIEINNQVAATIPMNRELKLNPSKKTEYMIQVAATIPMNRELKHKR